MEQDKWVSVRILPEIEGDWSKEDLLLLTKYSYKIGRYYKGWWVDMGNVVIADVTHWQPLPSPPNQHHDLR